jgi:uncharacterized protein
VFAVAVKPVRYALACGALFLGAAGILPAAAFARVKPSFDCAKASSSVENAICHSDKLATLDNAISANFRRLRGELDAQSVAALVQDQQWFNQVRELPEGSSQTLQDVMEDRVKFLRAINTRPANGFVGYWFNLAGSFTITAAENGTLKVSANAAEPTSGRWVCDFDGVGKLSNGTLVVGGADKDDTSSLRLTRVGASLHVTFVSAPDNATPSYCGANGSVEGTYFAVPKGFGDAK